MQPNTILASVLIGGMATMPSQGTSVVRGTITDPVTRAPLVGAVVTARGLADSAIVGRDGRYVLRGVRRDTATLTVRMAGYHELVVPNLIMATDTLHFAADLHTNPVSRLNPGRSTPALLMLIRTRADSLVAWVGRDAAYVATLNQDSVESVEVFRAANGAKKYGMTGSGGVIFIVMKSAKKFPFGDGR